VLAGDQLLASRRTTLPMIMRRKPQSEVHLIVSEAHAYYAEFGRDVGMSDGENAVPKLFTAKFIAQRWAGFVSS
jgi:hypothetical protein